MTEIKSDLASYLNQRARDLQENRRTLKALLLEQRHLLSLAKKYGLDVVKSWCESGDSGKAVKELSEFCLDGGDVPFFCETTLYELIGKDDARTVLALIDNVLIQVEE